MTSSWRRSRRSLHGDEWQIFTPFGTFGLRFPVAFYASLVAGAPIIIWQVMAFFLPALKEKERAYILPTFAARSCSLSRA